MGRKLSALRHIAHISDLHFGRLDPVAAEGLLSALNTQPPDLLVVSGDLTQRARVGQFRAAAEFLRRLPRPQLVVPGNHDVPLWNIIRRLAAPTRRFEQLISPDLMPVYVDDEMLVVGCNSARSFCPRINGFWKDGKIDHAQLAQLKSIFAKHPTVRHRILVTHHPFMEPVGGHRHGLIHNCQAILQTMEDCRVDLILGGHLHVAFDGMISSQHPGIMRPILHVLAGSATSTRRRDPFNSFARITLGNGPPAVSHVRLTGRAL